MQSNHHLTRKINMKEYRTKLNLNVEDLNDFAAEGWILSSVMEKYGNDIFWLKRDKNYKNIPDFDRGWYACKVAVMKVLQKHKFHVINIEAMADIRDLQPPEED